MRIRSFFFSTILSLICTLSYSQNFITNYTPEQYGASFSNWRVIQSNSGEVFIGNLEGLLKYNGKWSYNKDFSLPTFELYEADSSILIGSKNNIGFLTADISGTLRFQSLLSLFPKIKSINDLAGVTIWSISHTTDGLFFYSQNGIYKWDGEHLKIWGSSAKNPYVSKITALNDKIYCIQKNVGVVEFSENEKKTLIPDSTLGRMIYMDSLNSGLLLVTETEGVMTYKNESLSAVDGDFNNILTNSKVFSFTPLNIDFNKSYAASTTLDGIFILDENFNITEHIDAQSGLVSNTIKQVSVDSQQNLWVASVGGVSMVEVNSPWTIFNEKDKLSGAVVDIGIKGNQIFIGTTEGLYKLENDTINKLMSIKVWDIYTDENNLLVVSEQGLFSVDTDITKVGEDGTAIKKISGNQYVQIVPKQGILNWNGKSKIYDTTNRYTNSGLIGSSIIVKDSSIWVSVKETGVLQFPGMLLNNSPVLHLIDGAKDIRLEKFNNQLFAATNKGLFTFDVDNNQFLPVEELDYHFTAIKGINKNRMIAGYKIGTTNYIKEVVYDSALDKYKLTGNKYARPVFSEIINFEVTPKHIWVCASNGLFRYNRSDTKETNFEFKTIITQVSINDSTIFNGQYAQPTTTSLFPALTTNQPESYKFSLEPTFNNIGFQFTGTSFEASERNQFSYYLKNNDQTWSKWSTETKKEYTNLPAGEYTFMVKAKNIYDTIGRTAIYQFTILPPWYQTTWAYIGFGILSILFVWFVSLAYTYRVRMHRRKLKLIVADRTFEVISQKKEIESQNQLLKTQYSEISNQKDEIELKNSELQQSQEEILTINEKLKELNSHLEKKVEQRTIKIKTTLIKLKKTNKELDTFIYRASHDLKGPISRIHGLTSLAKLEAKDASNTKYYDLIEHAALDMQGLLSKLSHAYEIMNKEVAVETIDIPFLLSEIRNAVKFLDQGTKYSFDIQEKLSLQSDKYLLKIILENVIENALVFRQRNKDHEISIKCFEENNNFYFQIADNGIGINPDHTNSIFEMFFRGSDQSKGSGLGLYITRLALDKIQGSIEVESTMYQYSKFTITIPLR